MKSTNKILILILSIGLLKTTPYAMVNKNNIENTENKEKTKDPINCKKNLNPNEIIFNQKDEKNLNPIEFLLNLKSKKGFNPIEVFFNKKDEKDGKKLNLNKIILDKKDEKDLNPNKIILDKKDEKNLNPKRIVFNLDVDQEENKEGNLKLRKNYEKYKDKFISIPENIELLLRLKNVISKETTPKNNINITISKEELKDLCDLLNQIKKMININIKNIQDSIENNNKLTMPQLKNYLKQYDEIKEERKEQGKKNEFLSVGEATITNVNTLELICRHMLTLTQNVANLELFISYLDKIYKEFKGKQVLDEKIMNRIRYIKKLYNNFYEEYKSKVCEVKFIMDIFFGGTEIFGNKKYKKIQNIFSITNEKPKENNLAGFIQEEKNKINEISPCIEFTKNCIIYPIHKTQFQYMLPEIYQTFLYFLNNILELSVCKKNFAMFISREAIPINNKRKINLDNASKYDFQCHVEDFYNNTDKNLSITNKAIEFINTISKIHGTKNYYEIAENNSRAFLTHFGDFNDRKNNNDLINLNFLIDRIYNFIKNVYIDSNVKKTDEFFNSIDLDTKTNPLQFPQKKVDYIENVPKSIDKILKDYLAELYIVVKKFAIHADILPEYKKDFAKFEDIIRKGKLCKDFYDTYNKSVQKNYEEKNLEIGSNLDDDVLEYSWNQLNENLNNIKNCMENINLFPEIKNGIPIKKYKLYFLENIRDMTTMSIKYLEKYYKIFLVENNETIDIRNLYDPNIELCKKIKEELEKYRKIFKEFRAKIELEIQETLNLENKKENTSILDKSEQKIIEDILKNDKNFNCNKNNENLADSDSNSTENDYVKRSLIQNLKALKSLFSAYDSTIKLGYNTDIFYKNLKLEINPQLDNQKDQTEQETNNKNKKKREKKKERKKKKEEDNEIQFI